MARVPQAQFQFCGPTYLEVSPVLDAQRSINLYAEPTYRSSKTGMGLIGRPGLQLFGTMSGSPLHGLWAGNGRLFCAGGGHVYEVDNSGGVITDYGAGLIVGPNPVQFSANGTQLLICDPVAGKIFNVNPGGPSLDLVFNGVALEYLDGFYVAIATGASLVGSNPNQINVSANLDGTTWPGLGYALRTGTADLTLQLGVLNSQLWIFGQKSIEVWYNAGTPIFPFARIQGATIGIGILAAQSLVKFYNTLMWLGADDRGYAQVYMAQGLNAVRVSNSAIEHLIAAYPSTSLLQQHFAYGYQEEGHTFYCLNLVNSLGPTTQVVYDLTTGLWHERSYANGLGPFPMCFASNATFGSDIPNFVGDAYSGKIFTQAISIANDGDSMSHPITYTRTAPHVSAGNERTFHNRLELDGDLGAAQPTLDWSDDGGRNFGGRTRAMQQAAPPSGDLSPTFRRYYAKQLGQSRDRVYQMTITSGTDLVRIANAYLDVEEGDA